MNAVAVAHSIPRVALLLYVPQRVFCYRAELR